MSNISVLIIDDETAVQKAVSTVLKREQMDVSCAGSGQLALDILKENTFDIILLDVIMPEQDGFDLLAELRRRRIYTPVILLSGKTEDAAQVEGLGLGADDYITKPFTLALVKMHIEAVLKRAGKLRTMVEYNDLQADVNAQLLFYKEQHIPTTRKEFDLMVYFMEHPGIVLPRDTILNAVWEYDYTGDVRTIDTLVKQLRKKMGEGCNYIRTVYGVGYIFGEDIHEN